ncbi:hypothetical protein FRACYDRAFT_250684 [Fragilariopsis cylindrus CCMP1102]|uniref:Uncharacterized protein n=1 Tax=Fragilariopsis cylindrus CCMP1102 TaxID=635003 RepID=A0A1E7EPE7_9STRA|nr:hypothetical protein FRACYDRAFT_250684 [Fragilariopsis cylindrus CCMP1102]|eukprot:OEU07666.1 hypothetical protein FRACYDRAFT_250684 [Fragilariopsis cylindrus CCMP1102]
MVHLPLQKGSDSSRSASRFTAAPGTAYRQGGTSYSSSNKQQQNGKKKKNILLKSTAVGLLIVAILTLEKFQTFQMLWHIFESDLETSSSRSNINVNKNRNEDKNIKDTIAPLPAHSPAPSPVHSAPINKHFMWEDLDLSSKMKWYLIAKGMEELEDMIKATEVALEIEREYGAKHLYITDEPPFVVFMPEETRTKRHLPSFASAVVEKYELVGEKDEFKRNIVKERKMLKMMLHDKPELGTDLQALISTKGELFFIDLGSHAGWSQNWKELWLKNTKMPDPKECDETFDAIDEALNERVL